MLTYLLDERGRCPAYDYLSRCIRRDIRTGRLSPGEKLPSKRAFARRLGVSVVTVEAAYGQLIAEGYLRAEERRGYFVNPIEAPQSSPPSLPVCLEPPAAPPCLMDFHGGGVANEKFPFTLWAKLMRQAISEQERHLFDPIPFHGVLALRQAISDYLYRARGITAHPEQVILGAGTEYLYLLLVQLLGRDRVYGVEDPGYAKIAHIYQACGASVCPLPLDGHGPELSSLSNSSIQILHLSPSHHYPTGAVTPVGRRQALLEWARQKPDRYIIEDDYDSEFRFIGRPLPTLQSIDTDQRVVYMNTFSRTIGPALRISYMLLPPALLERYRQQLGFYSCTVPSLEQYTLAKFISGGGFERHINRMKAFYRTKRDQVISIIQASPLGPRSHIREENAGLHFLLELDTACPDQEASARARKSGIRLSFLSNYTRRPERVTPHCLVVNYAGLDTTLLPQALDILSEILF